MTRNDSDNDDTDNHDNDVALQMQDNDNDSDMIHDKVTRKTMLKRCWQLWRCEQE